MFKYLFYGVPTVTKSNYDFKLQFSFDKRKEESTKMITKYPEKIPIIIEKSTAPPYKDTPILNKEKYLVNKDITIGSFIYTLRHQTNSNSLQELDPKYSLYLSVGNVYTPKTEELLGDLYSKYKDRDLFLYMTYQII